MRLCNVAVVMGGVSPEHPISLKSGMNVLAHLSSAKYKTRAVVILEDGSWCLPEGEVNEENLLCLKDELRPEGAIAALVAWGMDVAYLALHGPNGEDGTVQGLFHMAGIPYTGSGIEASAVCMNKNLTRMVAAQEGVRIAPAILLSKEEIDAHGIDLLDKIKRATGYPVYIKSLRSGSSLGVHLVEKQEALAAALDQAFRIDEQVLIEKEIKGREITCGVLSGLSDEFRALPPVEIRSKHRFFDYKSKYNAALAEEICPAQISAKDLARVQETAVALCRRVGTRGIARVDFIFDESDLWFLEINTIPGLTPESIVLKEAKTANMSLEALMEYPIQAAIEFSRRIPKQYPLQEEL
ncbi:MAG: D-alanine--D-alanine ligase family protein [Planctomycetota bacterium]